MLFRDAKDNARLLTIGARVAVNAIPSIFPISLGTYIVVPGYIVAPEREKNSFALMTSALSAWSRVYSSCLRCYANGRSMIRLMKTTYITMGRARGPT